MLMKLSKIVIKGKLQDVLSVADDKAHLEKETVFIRDADCLVYTEQTKTVQELA